MRRTRLTGSGSVDPPGLARVADSIDTPNSKIYTTAKRQAGVSKIGGIHGLRHAFATHSLEAGLDLPTLGRMLGHTNVTTTMRYLHTTTQRVAAQISPLDRLLLGTRPEPEPPAPRTP